MCVYAGSAPVIDLTADIFRCNTHVAKDLHTVRAAQGVEQSRVGRGERGNGMERDGGRQGGGDSGAGGEGERRKDRRKREIQRR